MRAAIIALISSSTSYTTLGGSCSLDAHARSLGGGAFSRKDGQFRTQQQSELQALLKRIDARRKEHLKQRTLDSKRLLQRNRNVQSVLESKQSAESSATFMEIRKNLMRSTTQLQAANMAANGAGAGGSVGTLQVAIDADGHHQGEGAIEGSYRDYGVRYISSHGPGAHKHSRFVCGAAAGSAASVEA